LTYTTLHFLCNISFITLQAALFCSELEYEVSDARLVLPVIRNEDTVVQKTAYEFQMIIDYVYTLVQFVHVSTSMHKSVDYSATTGC